MVFPVLVVRVRVVVVPDALRREVHVVYPRKTRTKSRQLASVHSPVIDRPIVNLHVASFRAATRINKPPTCESKVHGISSVVSAPADRSAQPLETRWPARWASRRGARRMFAAYQGGPFVEVFTPQVRPRRETPSPRRRVGQTRASCRTRRPRSTLNIRPVPGEGPGPATGGAANASAPSGRSRLPRVGLERDRDPSRSSSAVQSASRPRLGARRGRDADSSFVGHFVRVSRRGLTRLPYPRAGRRFLSRRARRAR